ncbi:hypothetical protein H8356DRAFT_1423334 [Neocallimastix lanati (nom. inval.)]|nr:hypothetical protein H8356DRAFT_1423334 [Neocallimastix sp. JGI-2020a]
MKKENMKKEKDIRKKKMILNMELLDKYQKVFSKNLECAPICIYKKEIGIEAFRYMISKRNNLSNYNVHSDSNKSFKLEIYIIKSHYRGSISFYGKSCILPIFTDMMVRVTGKYVHLIRIDTKLIERKVAIFLSDNYAVAIELIRNSMGLPIGTILFCKKEVCDYLNIPTTPEWRKPRAIHQK